MKEHVPILVIIGSVAVAVILMFWVLRETTYSPFSHRVPVSETTGSEH
jgi:hypothetical protein